MTHLITRWLKNHAPEWILFSLSIFGSVVLLLSVLAFLYFIIKYPKYIRFLFPPKEMFLGCLIYLGIIIAFMTFIIIIKPL